MEELGGKMQAINPSFLHTVHKGIGAIEKCDRSFMKSFNWD